MAIYELAPVCKILGKEVKRLGVELKPLERGQGHPLTFSFYQNHIPVLGTEADELERHELYAQQIHVDDTVWVRDTFAAGRGCRQCAEQCGFKSEAEINAIAGLNGRLRWVKSGNVLAYLGAKCKLYIR